MLADGAGEACVGVQRGHTTKREAKQILESRKDSSDIREEGSRRPGGCMSTTVADQLGAT